jgi:hypothetical protein
VSFDVLAVIAVALALLVGFAVWSQREGRDDPAPLIATSRFCPLCGHPVRDHRRRSGRRRPDPIVVDMATCRAEGCACDAVFTRWWFSGRF